LRKYLQWLYLACGALAGICLILVGLFVLYSIAGSIFGFVAASSDDFAGYSMLASSFLALAYTFGKGEHIRVTLLVQRFQGRSRRIAELWCLAGATFLSGFFAWYSIKLVLDSYRFGDMSTGLIPVPLWMPQIPMAIGTAVLFVAVVEQLVVVAMGGPLPKDAAADDVTMER
jgi:TRAP-type C4-dicarboxylate transport system permease small subunit